MIKALICICTCIVLICFGLISISVLLKQLNRPRGEWEFVYRVILMVWCAIAGVGIIMAIIVGE